MKIDNADPDISTIVNRIKDGTFDLEPDFQRDLVWSIEKQQKLIDSIIRKWHIPPIHLVRIEGKNIYEVLDGKQRLYSIYNFVNDEFPFNDNFIPGIEDFSEIHNKKFSEFPLYRKREFEKWTIRIFYVSDVQMDEATELFLRLNQGVNVSSSEKRNCIYGVVKEFLKEMLKDHPDLFKDETLGFENRRMAYQDSLDKIFFLEQKGSLDFRPHSRALERMYYEKIIENDVKTNFNLTLSAAEDVLHDLNKKNNYKLTKSTLISYYWFFRELIKNGNFEENLARNFIIEFESWREKEKNVYEEGRKVNISYVEFNTYLSKGWLDPSSLKGRHRILLEFYAKFLKNRPFEVI
jgi:hypothetical protein